MYNFNAETYENDISLASLQNGYEKTKRRPQSSCDLVLSDKELAKLKSKFSLMKSKFNS